MNQSSSPSTKLAVLRFVNGYIADRYYTRDEAKAKQKQAEWLTNPRNEVIIIPV